MSTASKLFDQLTAQLRDIDARLDGSKTPFLLIIAILLVIPAFALTFRSRANQSRLRVITSLFLSFSLVMVLTRSFLLTHLQGKGTAWKMVAGGLVTVLAIIGTVVLASLMVNCIVPLCGALVGAFGVRHVLGKLISASDKQTLLRDLTVDLTAFVAGYYFLILGIRIGRAIFIALWTAIGAFLNMLLVEIGLRIFAREGFLDTVIRIESVEKARKSEVFVWTVMGWTAWLVLGLLVQCLFVKSDEGNESDDDEDSCV